MAKVPSAGVRLGKSVPGKSFPGAAKKDGFTGKIGGTGNRPGAKPYPKEK